MKNKSKKYLILILVSLLGLGSLALFFNAGKVNKTLSQKDIIVEDLWTRPNGARDRLRNSFLAINQGNPFNSTAIYNSQLRSAAFLQYAFDNQKTDWIIDLANIYELAYNHLTERDQITFFYPATDYSNWASQSVVGQNGGMVVVQVASTRPRQVTKNVARNFKLWLNPQDTSGFRTENYLSSSQFIYALNLIMHYAAIHHLESHPDIQRFINKYYSVVLNDHYLRWIFNTGIPVGTFQRLGWACNGGSFSHKERVEHLRNKRFGTNYFLNHGAPVNPKGYCNSYEDTDGWIAFGLAHLMAANKLNPIRFPIPVEHRKKLQQYLESSVDLFFARTEKSQIRVNGQIKQISVLDKGGFHEHPDLAYSGYYGKVFPGWDTLRLDKSPGPVHIKAPTPPMTSWDLSHSRRLVHFYWSLEKLRGPLQLNFPLQQIATGYANNLLYRVFHREFGDDRDFTAQSVKMHNYICGNNGWYRVNYEERPGFGYAPDSLTLTGIEGGQAYFIKYNRELLPAFIALKDRWDSANTPWEGNIYHQLNAYSSLPDEAF